MVRAYFPATVGQNQTDNPEHLSERCPGKTLVIILAELRQHCCPAQNGACAESGPQVVMPSAA